MLSTCSELKPASSFILTSHPLQRPLLQLCSCVQEESPGFTPYHEVWTLSSGLEFPDWFLIELLNYVFGCGSQPQLWMYTHTQQPGSVWPKPSTHVGHPALCLCLRLGSCLTRGIHTVPGTVLGTVASMISLNGESTYSHCHLAHIFQLTFSDYQEICIIHALPAPSLLWVIAGRALSCSPTCTKPAAHAHSDSFSFCEIAHCSHLSNGVVLRDLLIDVKHL